MARYYSFLLGSLIFLLTASSSCAQSQKEEKAGDAAAGAQNHLGQAQSPYLRQHADNPVHWHEWGPEALNKAQEENKPLLISIGYAACHWCHVMEHESFMDTAVARLMNEHFIPIKIDREERPDIDQIYMNAAQLLSGRGGWPLNAFALPDGRPYFAGTYFPKEQWKKVLRKMARVYQEQPQQVEKQAARITQGIRGQEVITAPADTSGAWTRSGYQELWQNWPAQIDFDRGGLDKAPKFPLPSAWEFLLQYHYLTGKQQALEAVTLTLDAMAQGGIFDQIGGGFSRYSTDERWFVPHFEKMLYDNAQLVSLYAHAYQLTGKKAYARVIRQSLAFVEREMTAEEGGFYSSLNADSEGEEGRFYVWEEEEIDRVLEEPLASLLADYFQLSSSGNWEEGRNILHRQESPLEFAQTHDLDPEHWEQQLERARNKLLQARSKRERPSTDDKVLTSWNALMLQGYIDAYRALEQPHYLQVALRNARFLEAQMHRKEGGLWRSFKDGEASIPAFLDDYALLAQAYLELYEVTLDKSWLDRAQDLVDYAIDHFRNEQSGMFYYSSDQAEDLIARKMEISDNVIPASNSVMAEVLHQLGTYYYQKPYRSMARQMLAQVREDLGQNGPYYANWARLYGKLAYQPFEVAVLGDEAPAKAQAMQSEYLPTALFMGGNAENLPLLQNKLVSGKTRIYVCRNRVCEMPVEEASRALQLLDEMRH